MLSQKREFLVILGGNSVILVGAPLPVLAGAVSSSVSQGSVAVKVQCFRCWGCFLSGSRGWAVMCLVFQEVAGTKGERASRKKLVVYLAQIRRSAELSANGMSKPMNKSFEQTAAVVELQSLFNSLPGLPWSPLSPKRNTAQPDCDVTRVHHSQCPIQVGNDRLACPVLSACSGCMVFRGHD